MPLPPAVSCLEPPSPLTLPPELSVVTFASTLAVTSVTVPTLLSPPRPRSLFGSPRVSTPGSQFPPLGSTSKLILIDY